MHFCLKILFCLLNKYDMTIVIVGKPEQLLLLDD